MIINEGGWAGRLGPNGPLGSGVADRLRTIGPDIARATRQIVDKKIGDLTSVTIGLAQPGCDGQLIINSLNGAACAGDPASPGSQWVLQTRIRGVPGYLAGSAGRPFASVSGPPITLSVPLTGGGDPNAVPLMPRRLQVDHATHTARWLHPYTRLVGPRYTAGWVLTGVVSGTPDLTVVNDLARGGAQSFKQGGGTCVLTLTLPSPTKFDSVRVSQWYTDVTYDGSEMLPRADGCHVDYSYNGTAWTTLAQSKRILVRKVGDFPGAGSPYSAYAGGIRLTYTPYVYSGSQVSDQMSIFADDTLLEWDAGDISGTPGFWRIVFDGTTAAQEVAEVQWYKPGARDTATQRFDVYTWDGTLLGSVASSPTAVDYTFQHDSLSALVTRPGWPGNVPPDTQVGWLDEVVVKSVGMSQSSDPAYAWDWLSSVKG